MPEMPKVSLWNNAHLVGGLLTLALGTLVLIESSGYSRGSLLRMGPGYFPTILGVALLILGALLAGSGLRSASERIDRPEIRSLACISLALILFALTLPRFGLAPAIALLVPISALASPSSRLWPTVILTIALIGFAWLLFVKLLSLPLALLTW